LNLSMEEDLAAQVASDRGGTSVFLTIFTVSDLAAETAAQACLQDRSPALKARQVRRTLSGTA